CSTRRAPNGALWRSASGWGWTERRSVARLRPRPGFVRMAHGMKGNNSMACAQRGASFRQLDVGAVQVEPSTERLQIGAAMLPELLDLGVREVDALGHADVGERQ